MSTPRDRAFETSPTTLVDCGCKAIVYQDGSGIEIEYCDLHGIAPDLVKACEELLDTANYGDMGSIHDGPYYLLHAQSDPIENLRILTRQAKGKQ